MNIICKECSRVFPSFKGLITHIQFNHDKKKYYDTYMKKEHEGFCKTCGNPTEFYTMGYGYYKFCCKKCQIEDIKSNNTKMFEEIGKQISAKKIKTNLERYGIEHNMQRKEIMNKVKQTNLKKYGFENVIQNCKIQKKAKKKRQKTCLEKHGVKNYFQVEEVKQKIKQTCLNKYGVSSVTQFTEIKNKKKKTCLSKYGVEHISQVPEIFQKIEKNSFKAQIHSCGLYYRGSYEKDFLDNYAHKIKIEKGKSFKYEDDGKIRVYHSDYYITSINLIVEIKNSYLAKRYKDNIEKKKQTTLNNGYKWIMIVDKNYDLFSSFCSS